MLTFIDWIASAEVTAISIIILILAISLWRNRSRPPSHCTTCGGKLTRKEYPRRYDEYTGQLKKPDYFYRCPACDERYKEQGFSMPDPPIPGQRT